MCVCMYVCVRARVHIRVCVFVCTLFKVHMLSVSLHSSNPNAMNMKKVADLFGEVIGVLSLAR